MVIRVTVVVANGPRQVSEVALVLEDGASLAHALKASGFLETCPEVAAGGLSVGVWGRKASLAQGLRDQDRVELYRPLKVDPKLARRARFVKQGARSAGLFARKRPGAKTGY